MTARRALTAAVLLLLAATPLLVEDFALFQLSRVMCIAIAVIGLDLLTGHAGQISAGHGALFGLGAYTTVILVHHAATPYPLAVAAGTALCFCAGLLLGMPALRIRGLNLGLVTLAAAILFPPLVKKFEGLTGGAFGLGITPPGAPGLPFTTAQWLFWLDLAALGLILAVVGNLVRSRFGRGLDAIRSSEDLAYAVGVDVRRSKVLVFALSSAIAGFGGGLYQLVIGTATPDTFTFTLSLTMLFAAVVGGLRSRLGSLLGAAFVVYVPDYTAALGERGPQLVYAVALLLTVYLLPGGLAQLGRRATRAVHARRRPTRPVAAPNPQPSASSKGASP